MSAPTSGCPAARISPSIRSAAAQADVVDLDKAPVDDSGLVRFAADFMILKPREMQRGNRRVFYDYGNRGHKRALQFFNDAPHSNAPITLAHAGNGFFMRRGYAVAWLAWEGDMLPGDGRMVLDVPVATDNGKPITGRIRVEYIADAPGITCFPLSGRIAAHSYATVSLDTRDAMLTRRRYPYDTPRGRSRPTSGALPAPNQASAARRSRWNAPWCRPHGTSTCRPASSPAGSMSLSIRRKDPLVHGLGHVAVRDFISFLKYDGTEANPLRGIEKAYAWGRSQTGRCLRDFVYRGFNADAAGRRVFDGVLPHVAGAGRKWLNHRFASPIVSGGQQYEDHFNIADSFPFSYAWSTDHLTGKQDAILKRPDTDPLVFHTQTATEYWVRRGSLVHTDTQGNDLEQPDTVRVYCWSSSQHFADPQPKPPSRGHRAEFLQRRVHVDVLPRHARCDGPLGDRRHAAAAQPHSDARRRHAGQLRGMAAAVPRHSWCRHADLAERAAAAGFRSGCGARHPARTAASVPGGNAPDAPGKQYTVLVPSVDRDGNDVPGVRAPMVAAPLGTYTGWNLRARGHGHGAQLRFEGSYIPFPESPQERQITGDPRPSILERYADKAAYVAAITAAARELVAQGLMLEEDVDRCAEAAADWGRPRHDVSLE